MIMVNPMPDEFMPGHMARFAYVNGFRSLSNFISDLASRSKAANNRGDTVEIYEHFCHLVNIDQDEYLSRHTMMPIDRLAALEESMVSSFGNPKITHQRTTLLKISSPAYFCVKCAEEDVKNNGFSYWRRTHQIHGVTWCISHGPNYPLAQADGIFSYDNQPHRTRHSRLEVHESHASNIAIARYANLSRVTLVLATRYHRKHIANVINHKLKEFGVVVSLHRDQKRVSDICRDQLPEDWLSSYFTGIANGRKHSYCTSIDGASLSIRGIFGHSYILALAMIFEDTDAAIEALSNNSSSARQIISKRKSDRRSLARDRYFKFHGDYSLVAEDIGISKATAFRLLTSLGFPSLTKIEDSLRKQVLTFLSTASSDEMKKWKIAYDTNSVYGNYRSVKARSKALSMALEDVLLTTSNVGACLESPPTLVHLED